ncbi:MAG TPA: PilX N-terminal domain-containing pilus assembly protein [Rhodocyclaceae bacterium]|nr:PilX N-terminal domain-containing pilus assembly protein [Rhodocyclaceae bacterium]
MTIRPNRPVHGLAHRQTGLSLVVVLMFLIMLTLVGATSMQTAGIEERMASNGRDRAIALEAAEITLRIGEAAVGATSAGNYTTSCNGGLCNAAGVPADPNSYAYWSSTDPQQIKHQVVLRAASGNRLPSNLAYNPGYYAEWLGYQNLGSGLGNRNVIRVTAHAPGRDANTQVTLQSVVYQN